MSKKRYNPEAAKGNVWKLTQDMNLCCGENNEAVQCAYHTNFPEVEGVVEVYGVTLNSVLYQAVSPILVNPLNLQPIIDFLKDALAQAGYTPEDVNIEYDGSVFAITASPQEAIWNSLQVNVNGSPSDYAFIQECDGETQVQVLVFDDANQDGTFDTGDAVVPIAILRMWDNDAGTGDPLQVAYTDNAGFATLYPTKPADGAPDISYYIDVSDLDGAGSAFGSPTPRYKEITVSSDGTVTFTGDWVDAPNYPLPPKV